MHPVSLDYNGYAYALKVFFCIYPRQNSSQNGAGQIDVMDEMGKAGNIKHHTV